MENNQENQINTVVEQPITPEQNLPKNKDSLSVGISKGWFIFNAILVVSIIVMTFIIYAEIHKPVKTEISLDNPPTKNKKIFNSIRLEAKSAYVFDILKNEILYKKNESIRLPLASLTKIMTALTAVELFPKDSKITIKKEFLEEEGDTGLLLDESWKLKDLLDFSLAVSSNDGAKAIASVAGAFDLKTDDYNLGRKDFVKKMNERAKELGLTQTYFINESGLDEDNVSGGYGSAEDVSKLIQYILKTRPELLEATTYKTINIKSLNKTHVAKNTNEYVGVIPGLLASKTGYTSLAGGNLIVAFDQSIGRPIIVIVLGSSEKGRFTDVQNLVKASSDYIKE